MVQLKQHNNTRKESYFTLYDGPRVYKAEIWSGERGSWNK